MTDERDPNEMDMPDDATGAAVDASPEYLAMLRRATGRAPTGAVDWDAFHARLNARAELPLARLRKERGTGASRRAGVQRRASSWWEYAASPSRAWRSVAAAAAIAIAASVHALSNDRVPVEAIDTVSLATSDFATAEGAFESAVISGSESGTIATYLVPASVERTESVSSDSAGEQ